MDTQTFRTSTILIATRGKLELFRSRSEMPEQLRRKLQRAMGSGTAGTILIADPRGREEILKLLRGETSALRGNSPLALRRRLAAPVELVPGRRRAIPVWMQRHWARALVAFLVPAVLGACFYAMLVMAK